MCSSGGQVAKTDMALQKSQAAFADVMSKDYSLAFNQQKLILNQQKARLDNMIANPLGYTPTQLHLAKANINDTTATAGKQALGAAAAFAAAHGASDVAGGGAAQLAGDIAATTASTKAKMLADLGQQNEEMKRQNFMTGIEGLNQVGQEFGGQGSAAAGDSSAVTNSAVQAGTGATEAKWAGMKAFGSVLQGAAGIASGVIDPLGKLIRPPVAPH